MMRVSATTCSGDRWRRSLCALAMALAWAIVFPATLPGCAADDGNAGPVSADRSTPPQSPISANPADLTTPSRLAGLEMRRYIIETEFTQAGRSILRSEDPAATLTIVDPDTRAQLAANDIRVHAIPVEAVDGLVRGLPAAPVSDETWLGVLPDWRSIHAGPEIGAPRALRVNNETTFYAGGRFRLLIRAFPRRTEHGEVLRIECVPQFHQPEFDAFNPDPRARNLMGHFVSELAFSAELDGSVALLLTTEADGVDWMMPASTETETDPADSNTNNDDGNDANPDDAAPVDESDGAAPPVDDDSGDLEPGESFAIDENAIIAGEPMGPEPSVRIKTLGEELMASNDRSRRLIMLLIPVRSPDLVSSRTP